MKLLKADRALILWSLSIFLFMILPISPDSTVDRIGNDINYSDKVFHLILFGVFAFLLASTFQARNVKKVNIYIFGFLISSFYAGLSELMQLFTATRTASWGDFFSGVIGIAATFLIIYVRDRKK